MNTLERIKLWYLVRKHRENAMKVQRKYEELLAMARRGEFSTDDDMTDYIDLKDTQECAR